MYLFLWHVYLFLSHFCSVPIVIADVFMCTYVPIFTTKMYLKLWKRAPILMDYGFSRSVPIFINSCRGGWADNFKTRKARKERCVTVKKTTTTTTTTYNAFPCFFTPLHICDFMNALNCYSLLSREMNDPAYSGTHSAAQQSLFPVPLSYLCLGIRMMSRSFPSFRSICRQTVDFNRKKVFWLDLCPNTISSDPVF